MPPFLKLCFCLLLCSIFVACCGRMKKWLKLGLAAGFDFKGSGVCSTKGVCAEKIPKATRAITEIALSSLVL